MARVGPRVLHTAVTRTVGDILHICAYQGAIIFQGWYLKKL